MSSSFVLEGGAVQGKCNNESEREVHNPFKNVDVFVTS